MAADDYGTMKEYNESVEFALREAADYIKDRMPPDMGFVVLMSDFGEGGNTFYISNQERKSTLDMMQEFVNKHRSPSDGR